MLLNFLRWLRQNRDIRFRVLTGRPGELSKDFEALTTIDSFEPSDAFWYKVMRRLDLNARYDSNHRVRLREAFIKDNVGLIYVNSVASARMLSFLSFADCPVICHVHELEGAIRATGADNIALLEKSRPIYVAVSHAVKRNLIENHGIPTNRIKVIHGFVPAPPGDEQNVGRARASIRDKLGLVGEAKLICACGSIEARKGTDLFLQVVSEVTRKYRSAAVHFVWVGGAPDKVAEMRSQIASSPLKGVVHFVGHTTDTSAYYKASDVFLLTSREDPFPLVVMEAAHFGKPIVCFEPSGGAPEFIEQDAGFVVPDYDVEEMSERIIELLSSAALCDRMGRSARRKVVSRYSLSAGATKIATMIEDAVGVYADESWLRESVLNS